MKCFSFIKKEGVTLRVNKEQNETGSKYLKKIVLKKEDGILGGIKHIKDENGLFVEIYFGMVDVYAVLEAFGVTCPACAHAIKKLLCPGKRGSKSKLTDLKEAKDSIIRAIEMEQARLGMSDKTKKEHEKC
jgi:hypothetical protein